MCPILGWIVEHACYILNNYQHGAYSQTPYGRLHGRETSKRLAEFGNKSSGVCLNDDDLSWTNHGALVFFLGRSISSSQNVVEIAGGGVVTESSALRELTNFESRVSGRIG